MSAELIKRDAGEKGSEEPAAEAGQEMQPDRCASVLRGGEGAPLFSGARRVLRLAVHEERAAKPAALELRFAGRGLFRLVGVEDRLYPVRIDRGGLDTGAFDLQ